VWSRTAVRKTECGTESKCTRIRALTADASTAVDGVASKTSIAITPCVATAQVITQQATIFAIRLDGWQNRDHSAIIHSGIVPIAMEITLRSATNVYRRL
jgi:hypothetical protein